MHKYLYIYCICIHEYKTGKPLRCRSSHPHLHTLWRCCRTRVRVCVFVSLMQFFKKKEKKRKSTSLPRELSAIADLNPHRYLSAASSFWTAVAAVTKQVHTFFVFQEQTQEPQQSALGPFECIQCRVFTETGHKLGVHVNTVLPQNHASEMGAGLTYDHSNREWLFFLFLSFISCLWCCWVKTVCRSLFSPFFFFHYKYINI